MHMVDSWLIRRSVRADLVPVYHAGVSQLLTFWGAERLSCGVRQVWGVVRLTGTEAVQAAPRVPVSMGAPCAHSSPALHVPPLQLQLAARLRAEGPNAACSGARPPPVGLPEAPPVAVRGGAAR